jgi:hypothetical protein
MKGTALILILSLLGFAPSSLAQTRPRAAEPLPESILRIGEAQAYREPTAVSLFPGRSVVIDFRNGEMISFVQVSDPTYVLFQTNAAIESGQAKTIVLRLSDGIRFEHLTQSDRPNLIVTTTLPDGTLHTYSFDLNITSGRPNPNRDFNGIAIVPNTETGDGNTIQTSLGTATLDDLSEGLRLSIRRGYTSANDPIVTQIQELLVRSRNGESLLEVARTQQISMRVLSALGEIALAQQKPRALPSSERPRSPLSIPLPTHETNPRQ